MPGVTPPSPVTSSRCGKFIMLPCHIHRTSTEDRSADQPGPSSSTSPQGTKEGEEAGEEGQGEAEGEGKVEAVLTEEDLIQQSQAEYDSGRYSPQLLLPSELPLDTHTMDPEEDMQRLHLARRQLQVTGQCPAPSCPISKLE